MKRNFGYFFCFAVSIQAFMYVPVGTDALGATGTTLESTAPTTISPTTTVALVSTTSTTVSVSTSSSTSVSTTSLAPSTTTTTPPSPDQCPTNVCGWAVVADDGTVHGVIVCNNWCSGRTLPGYMGCESGCRLIVQGQQTQDGNVAGWHGNGTRYNDGTQSFALPGGGTINAGARMEDAVFPTTTTTAPVVESTVESQTQPEEQITTTTVTTGESQFITLSQFRAENPKTRIVLKPKRYASCAQLLTDYPGGVQFSPKVRDSVPRLAIARLGIPVIYPTVYRLNAKLDTDKDKVVCEQWQLAVSHQSEKHSAALK